MWKMNSWLDALIAGGENLDAENRRRLLNLALDEVIVDEEAK